jgi:peptidoglycan/xylan/chitin deacetylase (PgdA/CDA1 family)
MTRGRLTGVPIVDYHRFVGAEASLADQDRFTVQESAFRDQLQLIRDLGIALVHPLDIATGGTPSKAAVVTFDDGYSSHYEVSFPLLAEFGVSGTFFVNTSSIGTGEYMDWQMAAEMSRNGMRFGSHAHNHVVLTTLNSDRLREELRVSREMLEQRLGCAVEALATPYGFCDQHVLDAAWESGYGVVCTSKPWPAQAGQRVLSRAAVMGQTSLDDFRKLLENDPAVYLRLWGRDRALAIPRYVFVRLRPELLGVRTAEDRP